MGRPEAGGRHRAREAALQMLYQWEVGRAGPPEAIESYWPSHDPDGAVSAEHREFANGLVLGTIGRVAEIDGLLARRAQNWRVDRMAVIDRLILRLAAYELLAELDTPAKVVINEAIELARAYTGDEAVGFVNGILDAIRKDLRRE
jgi:transcription antitermination protein NusB